MAVVLHRSVLVVVWLAVGCSEASVFLQSQGDTLVLVVEAEGVIRTIDVIPGPTGPIRGVGERVRALFYDASIEVLGLKAGSLQEAERGAPLPIPDATYEATAGAETWQRLEAIPGDLAALRVRAADPCVTFDARPYAVPGFVGRTPHAFARFGSETVLMQVGTTWLLAGVESAVVYDGLPAFRATEMFYDEVANETWVFSPGIAQVGSPSAGFRSAPALPEGPRVVTGRPDEAERTAPFELFAMTASAALWRFDGAGWVEVAAKIGNFGPGAAARMVWLEPGGVASTSVAVGEVVEYRSGVRRRADLTLVDTFGRTDTVGAFAWLPGWGPLFGTEAGGVYRWESGRWILLISPAAHNLISVIGAVDGGLLLGGEDGVLGQYHEGAECAAEQYGAAQDALIVALIPIQTGFLLLTTTGPGIELNVVALRRRR